MREEGDGGSVVFFVCGSGDRRLLSPCGDRIVNMVKSKHNASYSLF